MDVDASKPSLSFKPEAALENKKNSGSPAGVNIIKRLADGTDVDTGNHGGANVTERIADEIEVGNKKSFDMQGMDTESCPYFPMDGKTLASEMNLQGISVDLEEAQQKTVCGSVLLASEENLGSSDIDLVDVHLSCTDDELRYEGEKYATHASVSDFDNKPGGLDASSGIGDRQNFDSQDHLCKLAENLDEKSVYTVLGSERNIGSGYSILVPSGDRDKCSDAIANDILPRASSMAVGFEHDNMHTFVTKEFSNTGKSTKDTSASLQEKWVIDGNEPIRDVQSRFSAFEMHSGVQNYVDVVSARQMEEPKVSEVNYVTNDELIFPFSSRNNPTQMDALTSGKPERKFEFRSFFPSENTEDGVSVFHKNVVEGSKNHHFLAESWIAGASREDYNMENIYATQVEESKLNDSGNSKQELCLASDSQPNCNSIVLGRSPAESFGVESGMKQMLGVQGNLNINSHIGPANPKEVRAFGFDLRRSAFSDRTYAFENNINMIYPGKVWEGPKKDEVGNSRGKFMVDFESSNPQPVEGVMSGSTWRAGEEKVLRTGSSDTSAPPVQSANCFRNFDIISDKVKK